jgi:hypothetical protein
MATHGQTYRLRRDADGNAPETVTRPCLRCCKPFESEGPHNRLCGSCARLDVSPYAL